MTGVFIERIRNYGSDLLSAPVRMLMHSAAISQPGGIGPTAPNGSWCRKWARSYVYSK